MAKESQEAKKTRLQVLLGILGKTYPQAHCELRYDSPLELLVATILSAQCTDKQVNVVTAGLFHKYRSAADYANASQEHLEQDLRRIGLFRAKAKNIRRCCAKIVECHSGEVPASMDALLALDGVGRKTANVVLGNAFGITEGVVVDTHVGRLSNRLGLSREQAPEKIERDLAKLVPRELWTQLSHWLIWHGRRRCSARHPDCPRCEIQKCCPSAKPGSKESAS